LPKYKNKNGRNIAIFTNQQCKIKNEYIKFPKCNYRIKTSIKEGLQQVRIIPRGDIYVIEIVYKKEINSQMKELKNICSIDLGLNNLITLINNIGLKPIVVNGKPIKSMNQYYNKRKAKLMSYIGDKGISNRIKKLTIKRNNKIKDYIHKSTRLIINYCIKNNVETLVIGKNKNWKQEVEMGKKNNQNFVNIPYDMLIKQLEYKCEENGIKVILTEESYTSGTSFLDNEEPIRDNYNKSRRKYRGLFISNNGTQINADVNGAYQIMKKVFPNVFANGIEGVGLHPIVVNI